MRRTSHFLVTSAEQPYMIQHLGQESRYIGPSTEPEEIEIVLEIVGLHQELVSAHYVFIKGSPHSGIFGLLIPGRKPRG